MAILPRFAVPEELDLMVRPPAGAGLDWPPGALLGVADRHVRPPAD
ncbi:hypothetical protein [Actinoplanes sp. NPDC049316]